MTENPNPGLVFKDIIIFYVSMTGKKDFVNKFHVYTLDDAEGGRFFFNMVKAGDEVMFAAEEDHDQMNWIYKLYTATGQSHRPALPTKMGGSSGISGTDPSIQKVKGGL